MIASLPLSFLLIAVINSVNAFQNNDAVLSKSQELIADFFVRYNSTNKLDLVFLLDKSGSVPKRGWDSMLHFVTNLLEHFTVDAYNTRVAIVTFSTRYHVNYNGLNSEHENKCILYQHIRTNIEKIKPYGYTALYDALQATKDILINSRPDAKKAVFVLTDGKSNVGPPPIKAAHDILSLEWSADWPEQHYGPQVEIYGFGIQDAKLAELESIAYPPQNHTFLIPDFKLFQLLARSLHGDLQEDTWSPAPDFACPEPCGHHALCTCGTGTGDYECVCKSGYEWNGDKCRACEHGYFKPDLSPTRCIPCSDNSTTIGIAASSCGCFPPYHQQHPGAPCTLVTCPALRAPENGYHYHVAGITLTEVANTRVPCRNTAHNSCHFACNQGYRLDRLPALVCYENGSWSGEPPRCEIVSCGTLDDPSIDGQVVYVNGSTTYGSIVRVVCQPGQIVFGDADRSCGRHARWSGTAAKCVDVMCPPLPTIFDTWTSPHSCTQIKQPYGAQCTLICRDGFDEAPMREMRRSDDLDGWVKMCGESGKWHGKDFFCEDVQPPTITCPDDIIAYTKYGQNTTVIHWQGNKPTVRDNSNNFTYHVNGQISSIFLVGLHVLQYVATDGAGNQAQCNRKINVIGHHAKVISCPKNITISDLTSQSTSVYWPDPIFINQDNVTLQHFCTRPSGDRFSIGVHYVRCYPEGYHDIVCQFAVNISAKTCSRLPEPQNGVAVCTNGVQHILQCSIMCNDQYEFAFPPLDYYFCDHSGKWVEKWPHCSRIYRSGRARLRGHVQYHYYSGSCQDAAVKEHIRSMSWQKLTSYSSSICTQPGIKCHLKDVKVHCYVDPNPRATVDSGEVGSVTRESPVQGGTNVDESAQFYEQHRRSDLDGGRSFHEEYYQDRRRRSAGGSFDQPEGEEDLDGEDDVTNNAAEHRNVIFLLEFDIEAVADGSQPVNKTTQVDLIHKLQDVEDEITRQGLGVNASKRLVVDPRTNISVEFVTNCTVGQILVSEDYSARCVNCPIGSYHNGVNCELCPLGTYQPEEARTKCITCHDNKTTVELGAVHIENCSDPCGPGTYSLSGLEPCDPCDFGTYQEQSGATGCQDCPHGTGTHGLKAKSPLECIDECQPGYFNSSSGFEPCVPCPVNTYQPDPGAVVCYSCPDLKETIKSGADDRKLCIDLNHCQPDICNHGQCIDGKGGFRCECDVGWTGEDCLEDVNECVSSPCQHDATCRDVVSGYLCNCSLGYKGKHCDIEIDECQSSPCLNSGSCIDKINDYTCYCVTGYGGRNCDLDLDDCIQGPCIHGNCTDLVDGFHCDCFPGFTGERCEAILDVCFGDPCKNGATCRSQGTLFTCDCVEGYTGLECQDTVDECKSQPCLNGGKCVDGLADYYCQCEANFAGKNCEIAHGMEFDLVFKKPSITDFAAVKLKKHKLTAITVMFWIRSHDQLNYGTPFSYSAGSELPGSGSSDVFTLYNYGDRLIVNGHVAKLGLSLNDGHWHHVCISWEGTLGRLRVHINGTVTFKGKGVSSNTYIEGGGWFILGQEQDSIGGSFSRRESFIGEMSQVQVFDYIPSDREIQSMSNQKSCSTQTGNVISWVEFPKGVKGDVFIRTESLCLDLDECLYPMTHHCKGNHVCRDLLGSYTCDACQPGWTGNRCEIPMDECELSPCKNNGTCTDHNGIDDWICDCLPGYLGRDCYHEADPCGSMPCLNNGTCVKVADGYKCLCPASTIGDFCQKNYDSCDENPCLNEAVCVRSEETFHCVCPPGYQGRFCDERIDFCASDPCENGGTCKSYLTGFECRCVAPWVGTYCTTSYKPNCDHFPCLNNGTCVLSTTNVTGYLCVCPDIPNTVWGPNCELQNICSSNPCNNGGTCVHIDNVDYKCLCPEIFLGKNCENVKTVSPSVSPTSNVVVLESSTSMVQPQDAEPTTQAHPMPDITIPSTTVESILQSSSSPSRSVRPVLQTTTGLASFPSMESTATMTPVPSVHYRPVPDIKPTSVTDDIPSTLTVQTSTIENTSQIDPCSVTVCHNRGTCVFDGSTTRCHCDEDFKGIHCDIPRKKVKESYDVTVTLLMEYNKSLKDSKEFRDKFKESIRQIYKPLVKGGKSKISIHINDIREGSVIVDFTIEYVQYEDEMNVTQEDMMNVLQKELDDGKLGELPASQDFGFDLQITKMQEPAEDSRKVYIITGTVAGCIICGLVGLVIIIAIAKTWHRGNMGKSAKSKTYRKQYHADVVLSSMSNAAFEADPGDDVRDGPQLEEHVYADINYELTPYAVTTRADLERNESFLKRMSQVHPLRGKIEHQEPMRVRTLSDSGTNVDGLDNLAYEEDYLQPVSVAGPRAKPRLPNTGFCTYEYPGNSSNGEGEDKPSSEGESSSSHRTTPSRDESYENLVNQILASPNGTSLKDNRKSSSSENLKRSSDSLTSSGKTNSRENLKRSLESLRSIGRTSPKVMLKRNQHGRGNAVFSVNDILLPIFEETRQDLSPTSQKKETNTSGAGIPCSDVKSRSLDTRLQHNGCILPLASVIPTLELPPHPPPDFNPSSRTLPPLPYRQEEERLLRLHEREKLQREYF